MFARSLRIALSIEFLAWLALAYFGFGLGGWPLFLFASTAMIAIRVLFLLPTFIAARYFAARHVRPGILGWIRIAVAETWLRLYLWFLVFPWDFGDPDRPPDPARTYRGTVLLVHGYYCNRQAWKYFRQHLEKAGWHTVSLNLEPVFASIDDMVPQLAAKIEHFHIESTQGADAEDSTTSTTCTMDGCNTVTAQQGNALAALPPGRVVLLCHSMGALVAREYLQRQGPGRIERLLSLGTPHRGTWIARFGPGKNARQMKPDSEWMRTFGQQVLPIPMTVFYSEVDNIVLPQENGRFSEQPNIKHIITPPLGHLKLLFSAEVARQVLAELS